MTKQGSNLLVLLKNPKLMILNLFDEFLSKIVSSTSKQYSKLSDSVYIVKFILNENQRANKM